MSSSTLTQTQQTLTQTLTLLSTLVPLPKLKQPPFPSSFHVYHPTTPPQWIFTQEEIELQYSYGGTPDEQMKIKEKREKGILFLQQLTYRLLLPHTTFAAAATFFHRFYMRNNFSKFHPFDIAATCLFVACKTEETIQKINKLSEICALVAMKGKLTETLEIEKEAIRWKKIILTQEPWVCEAITFDFYVEHPFLFLLKYFNDTEENGGKRRGGPFSCLFLDQPKQQVKQQILVQFSLCFLTDSLRTTLVLQYQPHCIAAACFYLSCLYARVNLPEDWTTLLNVNKSMVYDVMSQILDVYDGLPFLTSSSCSMPSSSITTTMPWTTQEMAMKQKRTSISPPPLPLSLSSTTTTTTSSSPTPSLPPPPPPPSHGQLPSSFHSTSGSEKVVRLTLEEFKLKKKLEQEIHHLKTGVAPPSSSS
ncbi:hypothetical protein HMI54_011889 [Coelomomyces lativittatus]|nr:hypothetical protein HMI56_000023 [Coelomomyces lativittatus]KAJ1515684.1 hypothetical protein HMI54_011889 [Coelomomyces lativittatus]KAJ1517572.1 hypothetical protein HMI55_006649 [Coelomomyces lativittatus]